MKLINYFFVPLIFFSSLPFAGKEHSPGGGNVTPIVFDEPLLEKGLEVKDFNNKRCIQLQEGAVSGVAKMYLFEPSAHYDLTLFYVDETNGKSKVEIAINDKTVGAVQFDEEEGKNGASFFFRKKTIAGISIQQWSQITLRFNGDGEEKCRIEKLVLTPVGEFSGEPANLPKPGTLQVFESAATRQKAREMLPRFVNGRVDSLMSRGSTPSIKNTGRVEGAAGKNPQGTGKFLWQIS
jgi:hypothetical protein